MKIYTCYFARTKQLEQAGILPVSVCRFVPKWFKGQKIMEFAPPADLLFEAKDAKADRAQSEADYKKAVLDKIDFPAVIKKLEELAAGKDIALCCYERPSDFCHRQMIAVWLRAHGVDCEEYIFGSKIEQPSLFD